MNMIDTDIGINGGIRMKKRLIMSAAFLLVALIVLSFVLDNGGETDQATEVGADVDSSEYGQETGLEPGNMAPDFELETVTGETVRLSDLRGEKVLLNFWATWCPPCRAEMPDMQKYHEDSDEGIILAVNLTETEESMGQIEDFLDEYGITFQVLIDETTEVSSTYNAFALPTSYLINSDGVIHRQTIGAINYDLIAEQFNEME